MTDRPLPQTFFQRDALTVAPALLGKRLVHGAVEIAITEVEAYLPGDSASHCRAGQTRRNAPMWGPAGHVYMYLCYGIHRMLNIVVDDVGVGAAILVRAGSPVAGQDVIASRRGSVRGPSLLAGPGKVGQALALDLELSSHPLYEPGGLTLVDGPAPAGILTGPRVGIDFAAPNDRDAPWRFAIADTPWVSHRKRLTPRRP